MELKNTEIDLDNVQISEAVENLKILHEEKANYLDSRKIPIVESNRNVILLQIQMFKIPSLPVAKNIRFVLPNPIPVDLKNICFIVSDLDVKQPDDDKTIAHYKDLLQENGIEVGRILPFHQLRTEYNSRNRQQLLAQSYDVFLTDGCLIPMMGNFLRRDFYHLGRQPYPIQMSDSKLKKEFNLALSKTLLCINGLGTVCSCKIGISSMDNSDLSENIEAAVKAIGDNLPGQVQNVKTLHLKTPVSRALLLYEAKTSSNIVKPVSLSINNFSITDELSTNLFKDVVVYNSGEVKLVPKKEDEELKVINEKLKKKLLIQEKRLNEKKKKIQNSLAQLETKENISIQVEVIKRLDKKKNKIEKDLAQLETEENISNKVEATKIKEKLGKGPNKRKAVEGSEENPSTKKPRQKNLAPLQTSSTESIKNTKEADSSNAQKETSKNKKKKLQENLRLVMNSANVGQERPMKKSKHRGKPNKKSIQVEEEKEVLKESGRPNMKRKLLNLIITEDATKNEESSSLLMKSESKRMKKQAVSTPSIVLDSANSDVGQESSEKKRRKRRGKANKGKSTRAELAGKSIEKAEVKAVKENLESSPLLVISAQKRIKKQAEPTPSNTLDTLKEGISLYANLSRKTKKKPEQEEPLMQGHKSTPSFIQYESKSKTPKVPSTSSPMLRKSARKIMSKVESNLINNLNTPKEDLESASSRKRKAKKRQSMSLEEPKSKEEVTSSPNFSNYAHHRTRKMIHLQESPVSSSLIEFDPTPKDTRRSRKTSTPSGFIVTEEQSGNASKSSKKTPKHLLDASIESMGNSSKVHKVKTITPMKPRIRQK